MFRAFSPTSVLLLLSLATAYASYGLSGETYIIADETAHRQLKDFRVGDAMRGYNSLTGRSEPAIIKGFLYVMIGIRTKCVVIKAGASEFSTSHNSYVSVFNGDYACKRADDLKLGDQLLSPYGTTLSVNSISLVECQGDFYMPYTDLGNMYVSSSVSSSVHSNNFTLMESFPYHRSSFKKMFAMASDIYSIMNPSMRDITYHSDGKEYTNPLVTLLAN